MHCGMLIFRLFLPVLAQRNQVECGFYRTEGCDYALTFPRNRGRIVLRRLGHIFIFYCLRSFFLMTCKELLLRLADEYTSPI